MGRNYSHKRIFGGAPSAQALEAQRKQHQAHEEAAVLAARYESQDLPEVVVRDRRAFCPYCRRAQDSLQIGVQLCSCEKRFSVPDTEAMRLLQGNLIGRLFSRRQEREERNSSASGRNDWW